MSFPWDQWQPHLLQWSEEGWSAGEIAIGLSRLAKQRVSRSAVIGRVHRLGLWGGGAKPNPERQARKAEREQKRKASNLGSARAVRKHPWRPRPAVGDLPLEAPPVIVDDNEIPAAQRRSLMQLNSKSCHWPVGTVGDQGFFFCGGRKEEMLPYCPAHCDRAWQPKRDR